MNTHYHVLPTHRLQPPGRLRFLPLLLFWVGVTLFSATSVVAQTPGAALNFDGVDDRVTIPNIALGGGFAFEFWMNWAGAPATGISIPMHLGDSGSNGMDIQIDNATKRIGYVISGVSSGFCGPVIANGWTHVAIVWVGNAYQLYIDGQLYTCSGITGNPNPANPQVTLGGPASASFRGSIDDVRIWSVARTAAEIAENKDCELQGTPTGLLAYFKCNQGVAGNSNTGITGLTNAVGGGSTGALSGFALTGTTSNFIASSGTAKCRNCNTYVTRTTAANGLGNNNVSHVFVRENNVYATTISTGFFISKDGGQTFSKASIQAKTFNSIFDTGNTIYCLGDMISVSTNAGVNFTALTGVSQPSKIFISNGVIYVIGNKKIYISTNGGQSFTNKAIGTIPSPGTGTTIDVSGNAIHGTGDKVYISTPQGLFVSTNKGQTFSRNSTISGYSVYAVGNTIYYGTKTGLLISSNDGQTFTGRTTANGLGSNAINDVFALGNRVYVATDNGLSISTDGGQTFINHTTANGLAAAKINSVYAIGTTVYAATTAGLSIADFNVQTIVPGGQQLIASEITAAPGTSLTLRAAETNTGYSWSPTNATTKDITVTTSGTYSVTATGSCPGTASVLATYLQAQPTNALQVTTSNSGVSKIKISIPVTAGSPVGRLAAVDGLQAAPPAGPPLVKVIGPLGYALNTKAQPPKPNPGGRLAATLAGPPGSYTVTLPSLTQPGTYTITTYDAKSKRVLSVQTITK